jgi:ABC-type polysaccharide/polyol phosphate export permease
MSWVHRSARGIELGNEVPTGKGEPGLRALVSAFRVAWSLRETFWVLVAKDFKGRYRAQSLGLFWSLAHPLVMMVTTSIAFAWILHVEIPNFPIFYLIGAICWQLVSNVLNATTNSMLDNAGTIKHTTFPRFLFPLSAAFSNLIPFGMELVLVFAFYPVFPTAYHVNESLVALPFVVLLLFVILVGFGLVTSALNARYRDVSYIVTSVLTMGFWVTPIVYSSKMAPASMRTFLLLNPAGYAIEAMRGILMEGRFPSAAFTAVIAVQAFAIFLTGAAVFRAHGRRVADYV